MFFFSLSYVCLNEYAMGTRILLLTNNYPISGVNLYGSTSVCHYFAKEWVARGIDVRVVFYYTVYTPLFHFLGRMFGEKISNIFPTTINSVRFKNEFDYIFKQAKNLIRFFIIYRPARFFIINAFIFLFFGFLIAFRYLWFYFHHDGAGHIQSLILCAIIFVISFLCFILAIIGDLFSINRKLLEDIQYKLRNEKYKK